MTFNKSINSLRLDALCAPFIEALYAGSSLVVIQTFLASMWALGKYWQCCVR